LIHKNTISIIITCQEQFFDWYDAPAKFQIQSVGFPYQLNLKIFLGFVGWGLGRLDFVGFWVVGLGVGGVKWGENCGFGLFGVWVTECFLCGIVFIYETL